MSVYLPEVFQTKTSGDLWIRSAVPKDAPKTLAYLIEVANESDHFFLSTRAEFAQQTVDEQEKWLESYMTNPGALILVAEQDDKIVSLADIKNGHRQRNAHIATLGISILSKYHRQGLGARMMRIFEQWARQTGKIEKLELQVDPGNLAARELYKKLGYVDEAVFKKAIRNGPGDYRDSISMGLWL
jgi:RimJ/RimL family protein N-acetyltransferase